MTVSPPESASVVRRLLHPATQQAVDAVTPGAIEQSVPDEVDDATLTLYEDPALFRRRFGFLWSKTDRKRLLFFQSDHRLSYGQIRRLHATKSLRPEATGLRIEASHWDAALGWGHIVVLVVVFGPLLFFGLLEHWSRLSLMQWTVLGLVGTSVLAIAWAYYAFYVVPYRLRVRVEREQLVISEVANTS